jgi:hypothetical protein
VRVSEAERPATAQGERASDTVSLACGNSVDATKQSRPDQSQKDAVHSAGPLDDIYFEALVELGDLAGSYARSAAEAAWRRDELTVGVHLKQLRLTLIEALRTFKQLSGEGAAPP